MKKSNLKEIIAIIRKNIENEEVEMEIIDLPNNKIKHIIIGNKKTIQPKKQSSMTTKQFQEFVIEFIKRQEETNKVVMQRLDKQEEFNKKQEKFNEMILQRLDNIEHRLEKIESCPTIKKELKIK